MSKYVIYTDGAYSAKRNQGGVGIVILRDGQLLQKFNKGYKNTTNNIINRIVKFILSKKRAVSTV